jgi:hypothetical protein
MTGATFATGESWPPRDGLLAVVLSGMNGQKAIHPISAGDTARRRRRGSIAAAIDGSASYHASMAPGASPSWVASVVRPTTTCAARWARSMAFRMVGRDDARSKWLQALAARRGFNRAVVALANKTARIAWALLARQEVYKAA